MAPNVVRLNPARLRSWLFRLPFFTRIVFLIITSLGFLTLILPWIAVAGALIPSEVGLLSMHRLNTYPVVHGNIIQAIFSLIAIVPLMERFEAEHGTLNTIAMFIGPFSTFPGGLYIVIEHLLFRRNYSIEGASVWVFLLLACEAVKQSRLHPSLDIAGYAIPTWTSTIAAILFLNFLIPNTSLLGHLCGALIGYGFELGYLKFLLPPERALRWAESKLNLLGRLPHYVSVDQKTFGRYGVLDGNSAAEAGSARTFMTQSSQRMGQQ